MKRILPFALILALPGCSLGALMQPPATYANATVLDERAALLVESLYQAAARIVLTRHDIRPYSPEALARVKQADRKAYDAVLIARTLYRTGNAAQYDDALDAAKEAIAALLALIGE